MLHWILKKLFRRKVSRADLLKWLESRRTDQPVQYFYSFSEWKNQPEFKSLSDEDPEKHYAEWIEQARRSENPVRIRIGAGHDYGVPIKTLLAEFKSVGSVTIDNTARDTILDGLKIYHIDNRATGTVIKNCLLGEVSSENTSLTLENCWAEKVWFVTNSSFTLLGGGTESVECRPAAIRAKTQISRSFRFPRRRSHHCPSSHQITALRQALVTGGNSRAAAMVWRSELIFRRKSESSVSNFLLSHAYCFLSDYGISLWRPFLVVLGCLLTSGYISVASDPTLVTSLDQTASTGIMTYLAGDMWYNEVARAFAYVINSLLNPFGFLSQSRQTVQLQNPLGKIGVAIISLLADLSLAMLIFAIRRRFRMD